MLALEILLHSLYSPLFFSNLPFTDLFKHFLVYDLLCLWVHIIVILSLFVVRTGFVCLRICTVQVWKERVILHLGWRDIDYAIRKDEPPTITETREPNAVDLYEKWERSNRLSVMFIKTNISTSIRGSVDQHDKVRDMLKAIDEHAK